MRVNLTAVILKKSTLLAVTLLALLFGYGCGESAPAKKQETVSASADLTLAQKLSLLDKGKVLPADDDYVLSVGNQLELLANKYHEPQDTIAEWSSKVHGVLHDKGVEDYNLNILKEINKSPKMDNTKFRDAATLYAYAKSKSY